jgi:hypothetical protein
VPRRYTYKLDRHGVLSHARTAITDPGVLRTFFRNLEPRPDGSYLSMCAGEENILHVEDTPFVVTRIEVQRRAGAMTEVTLRLHDGSTEAMDPAGLRIRADDILVCRVRGGRFPARFGRAAQLALLGLVQKRGPHVVLTVGETTVTLAKEEP